MLLLPYRVIKYGCKMKNKGEAGKRRKLDEIKEIAGPIANFVRQRRKQLGYTQEELAFRSGVGLRFLKEMELGKQTVRLDRVNLVLAYFGFHLAPTVNAYPGEEHD